MKRHSQRYTGVIFGVTLGLSLVACREGDLNKGLAVSSTVNTSHETSGMTARPMSASNTSSQPIHTRGFAALMGDLKASQQNLVREWYRRFGGPPMGEATPAQVAWMQARGYPMPADISRAESMSEAELRTAANSGDTAAEILYVSHLLSEYNRIYGSVKGTIDPARYRDPNRIRLLDEIARMMPRVLASGSPYAGYLYAAKERMAHPDDLESNAASLLAGLVWASKLGDTRANRLLNTPSVQAVNAATAGAAMNLMLKKALYANPTLFTAPIVPIPPSDQQS